MLLTNITISDIIINRKRGENMIVKISMEIDESKIRMQRARLKMSQKELAQKVKTSREKINLIENAKCKVIKIELLEKIANVFELDVQDLLKKTG